MIALQLLDRPALAQAQTLIAERHYLRRPVDPRCAVEGYAVHLARLPESQPVGYLLFGRPEATRCGDWYGSVPDVHAGRCEVTRWQVLNLARVWFCPDVQPGGMFYGRGFFPGFVDRRGVWRSSLASTAIRMAMERIVADYLLARPPCFPDEPYELRWLLSYCDTNLHRGVIYRAAGFEQYRINDNGIETWRIVLPGLTDAQRAAILKRSEQDRRARRYRAARQAAHSQGVLL